MHGLTVGKLGLVPEIRKGFLEKVIIKLIFKELNLWVKREEEHIIGKGKNLKTKQIKPVHVKSDELFRILSSKGQ